jgi:hypothetical protein
VAFVWDGKPVRLLAVLSTLLGPGLAQTRITGWLKYGLHSHHDDDASEAQKGGILTRVLHGSGSFFLNPLSSPHPAMPIDLHQLNFVGVNKHNRRGLIMVGGFGWNKSTG